LTSLNAANVSAGTLPDARLSSNVALRSGGNTFSGAQVVNGTLGINTSSTPDNDFSINSDTYLFSHALFLRGDTGTDHNHGLAYCGPGVTNFPGAPNVLPDGPVLWGYTGGALGVENGNGGAQAMLSWNGSGVLVSGKVGINTNSPGAQLDVVASSTASPAVRATAASSSSPALAIGQGTFKVAGAGVNSGTFAFIHLTTASSLNGASGWSRIDNPVCNNNPNALLFVTFNVQACTSSDGSDLDFDQQYYLSYGPNYWYIGDANGDDLGLGWAFNVLVIVP
jgi:hypothetical protein